MNVVKKQHYVPQGYLRRFANTRGQLHVFDKCTRRSFVSAVHDVANSNYFYDFGPDVVEEIVANIEARPELGITPEQRERLLDPQLIERQLGENVDARFPHLLDEVVQAGEHKGMMTEEQRRELSVLLSVQLLRLPRHRQYLIEVYEKTVRGISQRILAMQYGMEAMDWVRVNFDKKYAAAYHGQTIFSSDWLDTYSKILAAHIWRIGRNKTDQTFYTSDHPVVMHSHLNRGSYGIGSPGIEICFPLGPQYMLMLCDRNIFASYAALDRRLVPLTEENVIFFNSLQVIQCTQQVFCSTGQYTLATEMCAADPSLSMPRRELLITN